MKNRTKELENQGFSIVDAILSISLLVGIIVYGVYFSSIRLSTVYRSNLIRSINKEIERDLERLKLDFWSLNFDKNNSIYEIDEYECRDLTNKIIYLPNWKLDNNNNDIFFQSWRPGPERSKVFTGRKVLITRNLSMRTPIQLEDLNKSISTLNYSVEWGEKNIHWISIDLVPEAHSWCKQK